MTPQATRVCLRGDAFARGHQHGTALRERLQAFVADGQCRLDCLTDRDLSAQYLQHLVASHREVVCAVMPDIGLEIDGLAAGAGLSRDQAWLLQLRREVIGYHATTAGDCTTLATLQGESLLAQTVDLNGNLDDCIAVLDIQGTPCRALVLSFAGLLGYLGINEAGLAIGLNLVLGGTWRPGVPPYLAIRHLLDTCQTASQALERLRSLPLSSSRSFTLCDAQTALTVEVLEGECRVLEQQLLAHTNHYLHEDFLAQDRLNVFARNASLRRLEAARAFMQRPVIDAQGCFELFCAAPICVKGTGNIRKERTVAAVVMRPTHAEMQLRCGDPSLSNTSTYALTPSMPTHTPRGARPLLQR
ncbi:peptidase C45 [Pseudomonas sp. S75]|uniref:C45 family autoproteolytic acyltransferase/hydolase n=1 Tax=unclassified Pseudomonas TaxID=196821 RepID=UPI0019048B3D|nr:MULTISPECIES: C45 family peptidase [unclassified Pseudomonas]MBJ9977626.1 peptidase C45 [Pseudomonas sp. S30]MBK0154998.1 peptidase C45 [Pseudomonas sp. S75]